MPKHLREITEGLEGVKKSVIRAGTVQDDPQISPGTKEFARIHDTEEHEDRVGNPVAGVYKSTLKQTKMHATHGPEDGETEADEKREDKLAKKLGRIKEETLSEISNKKLSTYIMKASDDKKNQGLPD